MRILFLSFYYKPDLCAGSFRANALMNALINKVDESVIFDVITTLPNRYNSFSAEAKEFERNVNVNVHRIKLPKHQSGMLDQSKAFIHYSKNVIQITKNSEYDLVYATSSRLMTAVLAAWIARKKQTKLYLDIRDIFVDTIADVLSPKIAIFAKPVFSVIEKMAFRQANKINLVSRGFEPYFKHKYPNASFSWFTNGVDEEFIKTSPSQVCKHNCTQRIKVLYAGNLGEGQGLHEIIPSLAKRLNSKVEFTIIGDGGRKEKLTKAIAEYKLSNVYLLPPVARDKIIEAYQKADVLFLHLNDYPAFEKVLPSKVFEYAAMGKPILAGVAGYAASFIENEVSNAMVFSPCDARQGEQALLSLNLKTEPRIDFINKFSRENIMNEMAVDILNCSREEL